MGTTIGYLRVSTNGQDNDKFRLQILEWANQESFRNVEFVEEQISGTTDWRRRKLSTVVEKLRKGDCLVVPELSRLGRSTLQILEILKILREKGVSVYAIKNNWRLDDSLQGKVVLTMFALMSEIERDLISMRTREALQARKSRGLPLGRPKGSGRSKLDEHSKEIEALLNNGSSVRWIARHYHVTESAMFRWLNVCENRNVNAELVRTWRSRRRPRC